MLALLDAVIPEPFHAQQPTRLIWRGSVNQPLIPLSPLSQERYAPYLHQEVDRRPFQLVVDTDFFQRDALDLDNRVRLAKLRYRED